jgi:uncharacterized membrane protein YfhO
MPQWPLTHPQYVHKVGYLDHICGLFLISFLYIIYSLLYNFVPISFIVLLLLELRIMCGYMYISIIIPICNVISSNSMILIVSSFILVIGVLGTLMSCNGYCISSIIM